MAEANVKSSEQEAAPSMKMKIMLLTVMAMMFAVIAVRERGYVTVSVGGGEAK